MNFFKLLFLCVISVLLSSNANTQIQINARTIILQDYLSNEILYKYDPTKEIYPASMTKVMTSIIAFDLLDKGEVTMDEEITVSENAWRLSKSGYSSMFIMLNDKVTVEDLLKGIIIVSGNDACVALAEGLAGSEENFVAMMNEKAAEIGMTNTNFSNSSGINDVDNVSTVEDIMMMSKYLIEKFPEYYPMFKETTFTWDRTGGDPITQGNRNPLLYKNIGVDGLKTGYLAVEKYSLASSIKSGNRRLIAVGSGFPTKNLRSKESAKLLLWGLRNFDTVEVSRKNEPLANVDVWLGKKNKIAINTKEDIFITVPKRKKSTIKAVIEYSGPISAPVAKDDKVGILNIYVDGELKKTSDIFAHESIKRVNVFLRIIKSFNFMVWGDV